jgi:uncharacterized protein YabE (DUF348 family)
MTIVKWQRVFATSVAFFLWACQPAQSSTTILAVDGHLVAVNALTRVPKALLEQAGIDVAASAQVLDHGYEVDAQLSIPPGRPLRLQVRRPVQILVNGQPIQTSARTVGEVLDGAGIDLFVSDLLDPPADRPVSTGLAVTHIPSRAVSVAMDGADVRVRATSMSIAAALAAGGLPILGLDSTTPFEGEIVPESGRVALSRTSEALLLVQDPIPFESRSQDSGELELGVEQVLESGRNGLAVTRTRVKYVEGAEVSRQVEPQVVVRPPQDRLVVRGTKLLERTESVDGISITYWRVLQMYATVYSPCNSGTASGSCSTGTASGLPAGKGVVAVDPDLFAFLNGQRLYIPGYGHAVVGDVGGGYIVEQQLGISRYRWIDLGFDDDNIQDMTGWITVYFLAPLPASVPDALK